MSTDLKYFDFIVPCGIAGAGVTSLERELGAAPPLADVRRVVTERFVAQFGAEVAVGRFDHLTVSCTILRERRMGPEVLLLRRHPYRGGFWQPVTGTVEPGESSEACAKRELGEETGIVDAPIEPLGYEHSFLFGEPRSERAPRLFRETAFWAYVEGDPPVKLDSAEHVEFAWVSARDALRRVPFAGLKEGLRRAMRASRQRMAARRSRGWSRRTP